jgi:molybdate/tungstate transport system substrate-binding protein
MRRGDGLVVGLAVLYAVLLLVSCGSGATSRTSPTGNAGPAVSSVLVVNGAGTLAVPFNQIIAGFKQQNPAVIVRSRFAGSVELVRAVTELKTPVDVLGVADYSLIPAKMFGAGARARFATWYVGFASNRITFAYTDRSTGAAGLNRDNWYQMLAQPGVHVGRSNPDTDPSGYQVLQMLSLAQGYYHAPTLSAGVLANSRPATLVGTETQLLPALLSGQIDYLGIYRSDALQHRLSFIDLPPQIDLSDPALAGTYSTVRAPTSSGEQTGKPIIYALTVPTDAPNAALGQRFVEFVLSPQGQQIMRDNGFTALSPAVAGGQVPGSLQLLATPAALPGG